MLWVAYGTLLAVEDRNIIGTYLGMTETVDDHFTFGALRTFGSRGQATLDIQSLKG
jgi:hypothetical protein